MDVIIAILASVKFLVIIISIRIPIRYIYNKMVLIFGNRKCPSSELSKMPSIRMEDSHTYWWIGPPVENPPPIALICCFVLQNVVVIIP